MDVNEAITMETDTINIRCLRNGRQSARIPIIMRDTPLEPAAKVYIIMLLKKHATFRDALYSYFVRIMLGKLQKTVRTSQIRFWTVELVI